MAPAVGLMMVSGCSIVLNLDDRRCESHDQCSADGSSMCVLGVCEEVDSTTNSDTTDTTSSGSTTSNDTDASGSTSGSTSGSDTITDDDSSSSAGETTTDDTTTSSSTSGTTTDDTGSTGCSGDACESTGEESSSSTGDDESSESTGEEPPPPPMELITNHDFESTHVPWTHQGNPVSGQPQPQFTRTTDAARSGTASGIMRNRYQHWAAGKITVTSRIVIGVPYAVSMWVRLADETFTSSPLELSYKIDCAEFEAADYLPIFAAEVTNEEWTELRGEFMVPMGCTLIELTLYVQSPNATAEPFPAYYIDDAYATPILP